MLVSILHRITGVGLSFLGLGLLTWWLLALSSDPEGYARFQWGIGWLTGAHWEPTASIGTRVASALGMLVAIGLTWAFFQHLLSGVRHLVMDTGKAFELGVNKTSAILTIVAALALTAALWAHLLGVLK
jgi:succinate dehydrogenase / fumarate reductase cytochrome b subunit